MFRYPEKHRIAGVRGDEGQFRLKYSRKTLHIQASHLMGWEHVSVSVKGSLSPPKWDYMAYVKRLFWGEGDVVIQIHPAEENYVNFHPGVLHLWRKAGTNDYVELPPKITV